MNLLITAPMREEDLSILRGYFDTIVYKPWTDHGSGYTAETTLAMLQESSANALISELDDVSAAVLDAYPNLLFIGDCRANPANIDVAAATRHGIPILCTPARNAQAVAELLVGLLISFMRNVPRAVRWIDNGQWLPGTTPYYEFMGNELCGKSIGFVGFGAVGQATAKLLSGFDMDIRYYDPYLPDDAVSYPKAELDHIFAQSDIVSIHLPVLPSTRGMICRELLAKMRKNAVFVNTSRSAVIDMDALYELLKASAFRGAILDVYDHEPPLEKERALMQLDNVLATPHICGATYEVTDHQSRILRTNIENWFAKTNLQKVVFNKEVLGN